MVTTGLDSEDSHIPLYYWDFDNDSSTLCNSICEWVTTLFAYPLLVHWLILSVNWAATIYNLQVDL